MPRISLDVSHEQRRQLKTLSSYANLSMRDFILTRVFAENADTYFSSANNTALPDDELKAMQDILFKKAEIITLSGEKWVRLKEKARKKAAS